MKARDNPLKNYLQFVPKNKKPNTAHPDKIFKFQMSQGQNKEHANSQYNVLMYCTISIIIGYTVIIVNSDK